MARIPLVDPDDPSADPAAVAALRESAGSISPNVYRAMANHPAAFEAWMALAKTVYLDGSLTPAHRELAYLTASAVNECHY